MKTADEILATADVSELKAVFVSQWDTDVLIRPLTAHEVDMVVSYERKHETETDKRRAYILIKGCCDETGKPLFKMDQMNMLVQKSFSALKLISDEIMKLSGLMRDDTAPDVDDADAEKN